MSKIGNKENFGGTGKMVWGAPSCEPGLSFFAALTVWAMSQTDPLQWL